MKEEGDYDVDLKFNTAVKMEEEDSDATGVNMDEATGVNMEEAEMEDDRILIWILNNW